MSYFHCTPALHAPPPPTHTHLRTRLDINIPAWPFLFLLKTPADDDDDLFADNPKKKGSADVDGLSSKDAFEEVRVSLVVFTQCFILPELTLAILLFRPAFCSQIIVPGSKAVSQGKPLVYIF